jgi:hypothetical protein
VSVYRIVVAIVITVAILGKNSLFLLLRVLVKQYILNRVNVVLALSANNLNCFVRFRQAVKQVACIRNIRDVSTTSSNLGHQTHNLIQIVLYNVFLLYV